MTSPSSLTLCMGSSCFSRGNGQNLPRIQAFLKDHHLAVQVTLRGCRCGGCCSGGPNIWIDGTLMPGMTGETLNRFLEALLNKRRARQPVLTERAADPAHSPTPSL